MTDTTLVQGDFAPADTSLLPKLPSSPPTLADAATSEAVTAEPNGFIELGLAPELVQAVADLGYTQPTSVQLKAIPLAMGSGNDATKFIDLMVSSQTGSGKTAAFLLPVLHTLISSKPKPKPLKSAPRSSALWPKPLPVASPLPSAPSARTPPARATSRPPRPAP
jgi:hypothetical protein